jgi:hypothetical protein
MLIDVFKHYQLWTCVAWVSWIAAFVILETLGLQRVHGAIPLTWLIRDSIPEWFRWMLLGWLLYHFGILTNQGQSLK